MKKISFFLALFSAASFFTLAKTTEFNATSANSDETYTITLMANYPDAGIVSGGGTNIPEGEEITVSAVANPYFIFVNWTEGDTVVSEQAYYPFVVDRSRTLIANFMPYSSNVTITVSADPEEGGEVFGGGVYEWGTNVTIQAHPNPNYLFVNWTLDGVLISADPIFTFVATEDLNLVAHFVGENNNLYEIIVLADPEGSGEVMGGGLYPYGTQVTIMAESDSYENLYRFVNWTKDGDVVSTYFGYEFTVTEDAVYVAHFERWHYNVVALPNPPDACHVQGSGLYPLGAYAIVWTIYSCNDEGFPPYEFVNWLEDGFEVSTNWQYLFQVTGDHTLIANYEVYDITTVPSPPEGGTVQGSGVYPPGIEVTLTATANPGYEFVSWTKNRAVVSTENPYTFISALNDEELTATFQKSILGIENTETNAISISPNPTTGELRIESGKLKIESVEVFDIYGRMQKAECRKQHVLDISDLATGLYFVKIKTESGEVVRKVVKQ